MKKILLIHNSYRIPGGEDISVKNEFNFLNNHFEVKYIDFSNHDIRLLDLLSIFTLNINLRILFKIKKEIDGFLPDLIYVHNTWFLVTPYLIKYFTKKGYKVVTKLHNFRYKCSSHYLIFKHLNENIYCKACGLYKANHFLFNKYFPNSYVKSFLLIRQSKKLIRYIKYEPNLLLFVLTSFHRDFLEKSLNINPDRIFIVPNYMKNPKPEQNLLKFNEITYAGRISNEKGVENLIKAFSKVINNESKLNIIGYGPEYEKLKNIYSSKKIIFLGELSNEDTLNIISKSYLVATGTKLLEGQPTLLCEAVYLKVPVLFPSSGGIAEFFSGDNALSYTIKEKDDETIEEMALKINYAFENNLDNLISNNLKQLNTVINKEKILSTFNYIINE